MFRTTSWYRCNLECIKHNERRFALAMFRICHILSSFADKQLPLPRKGKLNQQMCGVKAAQKCAFMIPNSCKKSSLLKPFS